MKDSEIAECYQLFKNQTENGLKEILSQIPGAKILIMDKSVKHIIEASFSIIMNPNYKQQNGIEKLMYLEQVSNLPNKDSNKTLVFFVPSDPSVFKKICTKIEQETNFDRQSSRKYVILVINTLSYVCEVMLEEHGCYGRVDLHEVPLSLMPLDTDVYSSEQSTYLSQLFLQNDETPLRSIVKGILQLETQFGRPKQIACIGKKSKNVKQLREILLNYDKDFNGGKKFEVLNEKSQLASNANNSNKEKMVYEKLIIFDREVDYITPLITSDTVESMIDDSFKINAGVVRVDKNIVNQPKAPGNTVSLLCSNYDNLSFLSKNALEPEKWKHNSTDIFKVLIRVTKGLLTKMFKIILYRPTTKYYH